MLWVETVKNIYKLKAHLCEFNPNCERFGICKGTWLSMALGLAMMVLDVQKNLKPTQFYLLNNLCYNNFAQKSSPGGVLALGLLLAVYGPGLGPDGPGCPEKP